VSCSKLLESMGNNRWHVSLYNFAGWKRWGIEVETDVVWPFGPKFETSAPGFRKQQYKLLSRNLQGKVTSTRTTTQPSRSHQDKYGPRIGIIWKRDLGADCISFLGTYTSRPSSPMSWPKQVFATVFAFVNKTFLEFSHYSNPHLDS
jgi:hypothetical protein